MELLYIWIENFKNIHKQGFNFSPKHHFEFIPEYKDNNEENEVTGGELIHKEKKDYNLPDDFFGDSIVNITGIVGKNGSGKSSLLEFIYSKNILYGEKSIFVFKDKCNSKPKIITKYKIDDIDNLDISFVKNDSCLELIYFSNVFDAKQFSEIFSPKEASKTCIRTNDISTRNAMYFLLPDNFIELIEDNKKETHGVELYKSREIRKQLLFFQSEISKEIGIELDLFIPENIIISFFSWIKDYTFQEDSLIYKIKKLLVEEKNDEKISITELFIKFVILYFITAYKDDYKIEKEELNRCYTNPKKYFINLYIENGLSDQDLAEIDIKKFKRYMTNRFYDEDNREKYVSELLTNLKKILLDNDINISFKKDDSFILDIKEKKTNKIIDILIKLINEIRVDVFQFDWRNLSSGENALFTLFARFYSIPQQDIYSKNLLFLLDEPDLYLHPEWQKKLFNNIRVGIEKIFNKGKNKKIQIITSSHSPFIVSDLPKEHIIFLDKEKNGNCKVIPEIEQKETFGANIHTLFTNSFFMNDGLIGKFAEEKIQSVIDYLNENENTEIKNINDAQAIINIIGEPILKNQLQKMLKYKIENTNKTDIVSLKKQMRYLKAKISQLENKKK